VKRTRADFGELQRQLIQPLGDSEFPRLAAMLHRLGSDPLSPAPSWIPACHPAVGVLDSALSFLSRRVLQSFQAQFVACVPGLNLTLRQFSLLFILSQRPSITQAGFARMFGLDPSTCGVILRALVARGLILSDASLRDRRERLYSITAAGRAVVIEVQPLVDRSERLVFRDERTTEIRWMVRQLQAIVHAYSDRLRFPGAIGGF